MHVICFLFLAALLLEQLPVWIIAPNNFKDSFLHALCLRSTTGALGVILNMIQVLRYSL